MRKIFSPPFPASPPIVTETEERAYYREHIEEFDFPTHRFGRHVLFAVDANSNDDAWAAAEREAREFRATLPAQMDSGEFAAMAARQSEDADTSWQGGLLPGTARTGPKRSVEEPIAEALFELPAEGFVSEPIRTSQGWHVILFAKEVEGERTPFEKVRNLIRSRIEFERREEAIARVLGSKESR